ncbi:Restriction endonuclease fold toxin 5 [Actinomyces ruminicola]|uniref:Restriction endonuclease fold toxin 5 n=1 Tax=Actinomyces ruminicola TaxID=332524 RepID=A0A1G9RYP8_9ACTO|nr:Restriction endonuclease fold toxin 5 [Actinomyces ruminicola]
MVASSAHSAGGAWQAGPASAQLLEGRAEWWEVLRDRVSGSRWLGWLLRFRAVCSWAALAVLLVAVVVSPTLRAALGAWVGCVWLVVCWFALARAKTVSWVLVSGVLAVSMPWAGVIAAASTWVSGLAGVSVSSTAASVVVAPLVEEVGKLVPLAVLALVAPGRVRRLLASDWLVLGVACGAGFEVVEEVARRIVILETQPGLFGALDLLTCSYQGVSDLECLGAAMYSLSPFSGQSGEYLVFAGHAFVTGLVAGTVGLAVSVWRRCGGLSGWVRVAVRTVCALAPLWALWVAMVDHAGRNASQYGPWSQTGDQAPWWPVGATSTLTLGGHGRGWVLLALLGVAWLLDVRTLWEGGYTLSIEGSDGGGRLGLWRERRIRALPYDRWRPLRAVLIDLVATAGIEWRWAYLTLLEAADTRQPSLLAVAPARLRVGREEAARAVLDAVPQRWWAWRLGAAGALAAAIGLLALTPALAGALQEQLSGSGLSWWLAGILHALGTWWEGLSLGQKAMVLALAGAIVIFTGGTLGLAFEVGMGLSTVFAAAHGAADLVRDPSGTTRRYLSTHTPAEIAADLALAALTFVGGGAASGMGGQAARGARWASRQAAREARYEYWLWRNNRPAWRQHAKQRNRAVRAHLADETGAVKPGMFDPRAGKHYPGVRKPVRGSSEGGVGTWRKGRNNSTSWRSATYEEQITGVRVQDSYFVGGKEFDGFKDGALIEAKGEGLANLMNKPWGKHIIDDIQQQAWEQVAAVRATGTNTPIHWHIAEQELYERLLDLQTNGYFPSEIKLFLTPPNYY